MLCKCHWIVLYIVHFTAFCLGGAVFFRSRCIFRLLSRVDISAARPSVCRLSVCLKQSGIVSKRLTYRRDSFTSWWRHHSSFSELIREPQFNSKLGPSCMVHRY